MDKIIIDKNKAGIRIDKFLSSFAKDLADKKEGVFFNDKITRGQIIRNIKSGNILVNNKTVKPSYSLKENDELEINLEENNSEIISNKEIKLEVIFQDENIIVVNKPAGLQVHPDQHEKNNTLVNALVASWPEIKNVGDPSTNSGQVNMRPGIVHRLDKDTSGIIVAARNQKTFEELKKRFKTRQMKKIYWAIVFGNLGKPGSSGVIDKPLARASSYRKQVVAGRKTQTKVRTAVTEYKVLKSGENFSLLEVSPKTGRTHQIRVHLFSVGHPIVGDKIYINKEAKKQGSKGSAGNAMRSSAARQMLHAKSLEFELEGKRYAFITEPPRDFQEILASLLHGNDNVLVAGSRNVRPNQLRY
ncbi:MAG: RluA family pseudouridine synthase [Candidatus Pacebacteria bacterium]|nr:RluA family pseudouridine synthase [Candidatus Paceibacterota bacterium]MDR3583656.1 RluA family pseudouridine synthase [Candidatus Paceibacterota bacterium]